MNLLAHAWLSPQGKSMLRAANTLGDFFKGTIKNNWPIELQQGIWLHRQIDHFTDSHPGHANIRETLNDLGIYKSVFADLIIDHILAHSWNYFQPKQSFSVFTYEIIRELHVCAPFIPHEKQTRFNHLCTSTWFNQYVHPDDFLELCYGFYFRVCKSTAPSSFSSVLTASLNYAHDVAPSVLLDAHDFVNNLLFKIY